MYVRVGEVVGEYIIEEMLHYGKNSAVFKARKPGNDRIYCLKFVSVEATEIEMLHSIRHKYIGLLYESFEWKSMQVLVLSYCEGDTLERIIKQQKIQSDILLVKIVLQLCDVLGYLHGENNSIIYLDLKPSNIIINSRGNLTLIDFGSARRVGEEGQAYISGSPYYMAPEYLVHGLFGAYSDSYSLGKVLEQFVLHHKNSSKQWKKIIQGCLTMNVSKRWSLDKIKKAIIKEFKDFDDSKIIY